MITWITKDDGMNTIQPQGMENKRNEIENENMWQKFELWTFEPSTL